MFEYYKTIADLKANCERLINTAKVLLVVSTLVVTAFFMD